MKRIILLLGILLVHVMLFACAPKVMPVEEKPSELAAPITKIGWEVEWDKIMAEAKKEGSLTIYSSIGTRVRDSLIRGFSDKYGIGIQFTLGRGAEVVAKIIAERAAGLYIQDVYLGGTTTTLNLLKPRGFLKPFEKDLLLPEVLDPKVWWKGKLDWVEKEHIHLAFTAYPSIAFALYTPMVKPADLKSYGNLLDPKWKGRIVMADPTDTGPGANIVGIIGGRIMGIDFLRQLANQEPLITRDLRLVVEWVAHGKYPIGFGVREEVVIDFIEAGAPLVGHTPVEGTYLSAGTGGVAVFSDKVPHPNASRVFINWLLSKEGQTIFSKASGYQSGRNDVTTDHLKPIAIRIPGMAYPTSYDEEYVLKKDEIWQKSREIFGHLLGR